MNRWTNLALAAVVALAALSGAWAQAIGAEPTVPPAWLHGGIGLAVVILSPWKATVIRRGLTSDRRSSPISVLLVVAASAAVASGMAHALGVRSIGSLAAMQIHIGAGITTVVLTAVHVVRHPVPVRRIDAGRRSAVRAAGTGLAAAAAWVGLERLSSGLGLPGSGRRFTGSHERSPFDPDGLPAVVWLNDRAPQLDPEEWRLEVDGRQISLGELRDLPTEEVTAVLDCTGGWYSPQRWSATRLDHLVASDAARSIVVVSATGYQRRFPTTDLPHLWLAHGLGGRPLDARHGAPVRLVAPGRRGFWWVKWVVRIETSDRTWWLQSPFPLT